MTSPYIKRRVANTSGTPFAQPYRMIGHSPSETLSIPLDSPPNQAHPIPTIWPRRLLLMRRILLLFVFLVLPLTNAYADTMDLFTLIGGGHTQAWILPAVETFTYPAIPIFVPTFTPIYESVDGVPVTPSTIVFYPPGRGLTLGVSGSTLSGSSVTECSFLLRTILRST
jgi:hypothetical protein